jgi:gliding motility-associatede transport system auxiliary component
VGRSASLFGLLGVVFLGFGFVASVLVQDPLTDWYVLLNLLAGAGLLLAYLAFGFDDFRTLLGRRSTRYGAGALVYSLLFVVLVVGANYVSARHHHRWDVTESGVYTLAPQSRKLVDGLKDQLEMTAFVEGGQDQQLESLLESYQYAAPSRVKFRLVDPDKEPALVDQMKITSLRSVHLQYGKESFVVTNPTEETVTNGIIRVSGTTKKAVYFTDGHGEADIQNQQDAKGYANAKLALEQENYEVKPLVLLEQIPDDASVLVVAGPERPFSPAEMQTLDAYLRRGGRLLVLVGPRQGGEQFTKFLGDWGVKLGNDIVIDRELRLFEGPSLGTKPITKIYGTHPITQNFRDYTTYPETRTVEPDAAGKKGIQATSLVKTAASSRALTKVDELFSKGTATLDENDRKGPLSVAVAVDIKLKDLGVEPPAAGEGKKAPDEARLVVFGTSRFADNQDIVQSRLNGDLFLNAVGWLVGQEELVSIRSRSVRASRAELTGTQARQVFYLSVLILPQLLIASGIAVWWRRRSR